MNFLLTLRRASDMDVKIFALSYTYFVIPFSTNFKIFGKIEMSSKKIFCNSDCLQDDIFWHSALLSTKVLHLISTRVKLAPPKPQKLAKHHWTKNDSNTVQNGLLHWVHVRMVFPGF